MCKSPSKSIKFENRHLGYHGEMNIVAVNMGNVISSRRNFSLVFDSLSLAIGEMMYQRLVYQYL